MADQLDIVERAARGACEETTRVLVPVPPAFGSVRARARRRRGAAMAGAGAVAVVVVVLASLTVFGADRSGDSRDVVTGPPPTVEEPPGPDPSGPSTRELAPGDALVMSESPLAPRLGAASVWTGDAFLVWGGVGEDGTLLADGATYDPATDTWEELPDSPLSGRRDAAAAWTGSELVVFGGMAEPTAGPGAAAYDPDSGTWRTLAEPPQPVAGRTVVADRVVYAASVNDSGLVAYDLDTDEWTTIGAPRPIRGGLVGERGSDELIVRAADPSSLQVYDHSTGEWTSLPPLDHLGDWAHVVVGDSIVAVDQLDPQGGIRRHDPDGWSWVTVAGLPDDPALGSEIGVHGIDWPVPGVVGPIVVATDEAVLVYGGGDVAWVLHVELDRWTPVDAGGVGVRGLQHGAVAVGGDLVMVWSGRRSVFETNPIGDTIPYHRDGVVLRIPEPWPEHRPYTEFTTPRSRERAQGVDLELASGLAGWQVEGPTFGIGPFAYENERVLYLAPSVGAVASGTGPAVVMRLVDTPDEMQQPVHHEIAGFAVSVFVDPDPPHEVAARARTADRTVYWTSVGSDEDEAVAALGEWLEALADDWEQPGWDHAGLAVMDEQDGRVLSDRPLLPQWTLTSPDGATYLVRRQPTPEATDVARVAIWAMIAGGRTTPPVTEDGPTLWVFDPEGTPSLGWFRDDVRWVVAGLTVDDPNLTVLVENLLG